jgi:tripartite-type tricarboxylate transporter receptor subunit TctC
MIPSAQARRFAPIRKYTMTIDHSIDLVVGIDKFVLREIAHAKFRHTTPAEKDRKETSDMYNDMYKRLMLAVLVAFTFTGAGRSETFPDRPVSLVVNFAPGGLTDVPARMIAPEMQKLLRQPVLVVNKAGASGVVGATDVLHAEPDGYTLLVSGISEVQNLFYIHVPYDVRKDFAPIGKVANGPPLVLAVVGSSPLKTVADLIAHAKANPSKTNVATTGPATSPAIALSQLNALAGTKIAAIPYQGSGPAAAAVASGQVDAGFVWLPSIAGMTESGKVRILAVATARRVSVLPGIPTLDELGYKGFDHSAFVGLLAPRKTPKPIIAKLNKALNEAIAVPSFADKLRAFGMTVPSQPNTPQSYREFIATQLTNQGQLAKLSGDAKRP